MIQSLYAKALKNLRGVDIHSSFVPRSTKIHSGSKVYCTTFGRYSYCGHDCRFINVDIGSFCSFASGIVVGGAHHPIEYASTSPVFLSHKDSVRRKFGRHVYNPELRTEIGCDVWIGERALVKAGVSIGHGAVIGMGAVVTKDVPAFAIVAGNPARLIRMRFSQEIVSGLLEMQWWNYSDEDLERIGPLISNPERLLRMEGYL